MEHYFVDKFPYLFHLQLANVLQIDLQLVKVRCVIRVLLFLNLSYSWVQLQFFSGGAIILKQCSLYDKIMFCSAAILQDCFCPDDHNN